MLKQLLIMLMLVAGCGNATYRPEEPSGAFGPAKDRLFEQFPAAPEGPWIEPGDDTGFLFVDGNFAEIRVSERNLPRFNLERCRVGPTYERHADYLEFKENAYGPRLIVHFETIDGGRAIIVDDHLNAPMYLVRPTVNITWPDCTSARDREVVFVGVNFQ